MDLSNSQDLNQFLLEGKVEKSNSVNNRGKQPKMSPPSKQKKIQALQAQSQQQASYIEARGSGHSNQSTNASYGQVPQQITRANSNRDRDSFNKKMLPQGHLGIIPEEGNKVPYGTGESSAYYGSYSDSSHVTPNQSIPRWGISSNTQSSLYPIPFMATSLNSVGGTAGASRFYQKIDDQNDEDTLIFTRKLFSFFAMQKLFMGFFITFTYNNVPFTKFIGKNFYIFAIAAFTFMSVLLMVHGALDVIRKPPQSYICYIMFTLAECWVIAFLLATTDDSTVFLFAVTLTSMVLAVSLFLNQSIITFKRGTVFLLLMITAMGFISILTLNYTDTVTIFVCLTGGLLFGFFLLNKAFQLLHRKYPHQLKNQDYIIGSLTIYVDFGFVLLIMLFIMLAMIKGFTMYKDDKNQV